MTMSAVIERAGHYLMVREMVDGIAVLNQPAGHLEENESLLEAVQREVLEETRHHFSPRSTTGLYRWRAGRSGLTFMRVNVCGEVGCEDTSLQRDRDIVDVLWLRAPEIAAASLRSPLVMRCIEDHRTGNCYPLEILHDLA